MGGDVSFSRGVRDDSTAVRFTRATALAVDLFGNVFVLDGGASELVKLDAAGARLRATGGFGWKEGAMDQPRDLSASNGLDIYVADYGNHRILHFDRDLNLQTATATSSDADASPLWFGYPRSVATTRFGELFVADAENNRILSFAPESREGKPFGDLHGGKGSLSSPQRIRISESDEVFVQDSGRVVQYDIFGNYVRTYDKDLFPGMRTFALDDKNLYVLDSCRIIAVGEGGAIRSQWALEQFKEGPACDSVVDFQIHKGTLYLLTRRALWIRPLPRTGE